MLPALLLIASQAASVDGGAPARLVAPEAVREARTPGSPDARLPVFAVGSPELVAVLGPLKPEVGAWAEYLVRSRGEEDVRVRLSLLPPALEDGRIWLEVATIGEQSLPFAARLLLRREGDLERAFVYALGQAPIELSMDEMPPAAQPHPGRGRASAARLGRSQVEVPGGSFLADELRVAFLGETTRVWRSAEVPLWGLVRARGPRQTVELLDYARQGAHSVFPDPQGNGSERAK